MRFGVIGLNTLADADIIEGASLVWEALGLAHIGCSFRHTFLLLLPLLLESKILDIRCTLAGCGCSSYLRSSEAVRGGADEALAELHLVARERARLVGEDVVDLSELLIQVTGARHHWRIRLPVVHADITFHQDFLSELGELHRDVERDGHVVVAQDEVRHPHCSLIQRCLVGKVGHVPGALQRG